MLSTPPPRPFEEAKRTLSEIGWASAEEADYEQLALDRVAQASALVRDLSTDAKVTDCFLFKYDIANLKMLLKARCLGHHRGASFLQAVRSCGKLRHAVADHRYKELPEPICNRYTYRSLELITEEKPAAD